MKKILLPFLIFAFGAHATLVPPATLQEQLSSAPLVAEIHVTQIDSFSDPVFAAKTHATATVTQLLTVRDDGGWFPSVGDSIVIESLGGEVGETGVLYSGMPKPYAGHRYRATLRRGASGFFEIVGLSGGLVPLDPGTRSYTRNRTDGSNGTGNGAFLYWDSRYFPVPYFISLPTFLNRQDIADAIDLSFRPWRDPGNVLVEFLPMGCTSTALNRNDGINAVIFVSDQWDFDSTAIAITRNFYVSGSGAKSGMILDTDIMLNAVNYEFSTTADPGKHDVRNIITHEVGHFVGLGHEIAPKDTSATMYESAVPGETNKRALHAGDLLGLRAAYAGVGQKFAQFSSTQACAMGWQRLSCASTHGGMRHPGVYAWIALGCALALALGRRLYPS